MPPKRPGSSSGPAPRPWKDRSLGPPQRADVLPSQDFMRDQARSLTALWIGMMDGTVVANEDGSGEVVGSEFLRRTAVKN